MDAAPLSKRPKARQNVLRIAMLPMAFATAAASIVLPTGAIAQTQNATIGSEACVSLPDNRAFSLALAINTRVEPGAGPLTTTKASAILGGATSKLDQMRSIQAPGQAIASSMNSGAAATQMFPSTSDCTRAGENFAGSAFIQPATFKEAVLGTQSVAVTRTPFDRDWASIQMRPNNSRIKRAVTSSGARGSVDKLQQLEMVNRWVNRNIAFGEDQAVYSQADYWAPASETLRRGIGDCEDFAIAKMEMLSALGIARADMRLIIARDLVRNADHAVLVVKLDNGSVMLDNVTDRLLDGRIPNDYRPIMSFSQNAKWVHGYSVPQPATVRLASLPPTVVPAFGQLPEVATVTAELQLPEISVAWLSAPLVLPTLL
ncbi:MAG: transglutaminase-like cysteine peptidase [Sphingorhabdus sp.]